jgi:hypothetical protein
MKELRKSKWSQGRITTLVLALLVGGMMVSAFRDYWAAFWIFQSPRQATATVTAQQSHGVCEYLYSVNGIQFTGHGQRGRTFPSDARVGKQVPVYFSSSRPWLSSPEAPAFSTLGTLTIMALYLAAEVFLVKAVVKPGGADNRVAPTCSHA